MANNHKFITFILGAGASFEVDMPTGNKLKDKIAASLSFKVNSFRHLEGGDNGLREALYALGQQQGNSGSVNDYFNAAKQIGAGMPQAPSSESPRVL